MAGRERRADARGRTRQERGRTGQEGGGAGEEGRRRGAVRGDARRPRGPAAHHGAPVPRVRGAPARARPRGAGPPRRARQGPRLHHQGRQGAVAHGPAPRAGPHHVLRLRGGRGAHHAAQPRLPRVHRRAQELPDARRGPRRARGLVLRDAAGDVHRRARGRRRRGRRRAPLHQQHQRRAGLRLRERRAHPAHHAHRVRRRRRRAVDDRGARPQASRRRARPRSTRTRWPGRPSSTRPTGCCTR